MQRLFLFVTCFATMLALFAVRSQAGDDCPGMTDYTYSGGSCSQAGADFFAPLEKSYDREYDNQIHAMRGARSSFQTNPMETAREMDAEISATFYASNIPSDTPLILPREFARSASRNPRAQQRYENLLTDQIRKYESSVRPKLGSTLTLHNIILAETTAAMKAYDDLGVATRQENVSMFGYVIQYKVALATNLGSLSLEQRERMFEYSALLTRALTPNGGLGTTAVERQRAAVHFLRDGLGFDLSTTTPNNAACHVPYFEQEARRFGCQWVINLMRRG